MTTINYSNIFSDSVTAYNYIYIIYLKHTKRIIKVHNYFINPALLSYSDILKIQPRMD